MNNISTNKIKIKLCSVSKESLELYKIFFISHLNKKFSFISVIDLPKKTKNLTLLKSPHVNKRFKESFEYIEHRTLISIKCDCSNDDINNLFLFYPNLIINKPKSVSLKFVFRKNG